MMFLSAGRLALLVVPAVLLAAYLFVVRRRANVVTRFSSVDLLASVAPKRSGWQRHVPWVVLILALVIGVLAFAQPAVVMRTPKDKATIMLTMDTSRSMASDDVLPSRLAAAQVAAKSFVDGLPPGIQVGLVTFDHNATLAQSPTNDRAELLAAIESMHMGTGTDTGAGLDLSLNAVGQMPEGVDGRKPPAAIVLMSDGTPTIGTGDLSPEASVDDQVKRARSMGVPISTIAFGTGHGTVTAEGQTIPVPYDPAALRGIAETTGGQAFTAESAAELSSVYDEIGSVVGYETETVDLSAWFAGAAFVLGALAAAAALIWTQALA